MVGEKGAIAVSFLVSATLLLLILVLIIDFGILWNYNAELERAVDAAALAGASEVYVSRQVDGLGTVYWQNIYLDGARARQTAQSTLDQNLAKFIKQGVTVKSVNININGFEVEVIVTLDARHYFTALSGFRSTEITKRAVATYAGP
ncbi:MAG: pilus assembly protein TadG-related protein [Candidatus Methanomethyliaceae archaeon]